MIVYSATKREFVEDVRSNRIAEIIENELTQPTRPAPKPLPIQKTIKHLSKSLDTEPKRTFKVNTQDVYALLVTLQGKNAEAGDIERARKAFPILWHEIQD